jgi:heme-degrading monooxygenase HmoA
MVQIVWEFIVKEEIQDQFELVYGPGGAWSKLFSSSPGYRGTTLLRDTEHPRKYLTIDIWDTLEQREQMLEERSDEYAIVHAKFAEWMESHTKLGIFRVLAEATVRPRGKPRHRRPR